MILIFANVTLSSVKNKKNHIFFLSTSSISQTHCPPSYTKSYPNWYNRRDSSFLETVSVGDILSRSSSVVYRSAWGESATAGRKAESILDTIREFSSTAGSAFTSPGFGLLLFFIVKGDFVRIHSGSFERAVNRTHQH